MQSGPQVKSYSSLARPNHRKAISLQLSSTPDSLESELYSVRTVREKVARRSHFQLDTYFGDRDKTTGKRDIPVCHSTLPTLSSPRFPDYVETEPVNSKLLSHNTVSKRTKVIKRLRNMHTFLPPVHLPRPSSRDELIKDSLQLLSMKRQLQSYLLKGPKLAFNYYCRRGGDGGL